MTCKSIISNILLVSSHCTTLWRRTFTTLCATSLKLTQTLKQLDNETEFKCFNFYRLIILKRFITNNLIFHQLISLHFFELTRQRPKRKQLETTHAPFGRIPCHEPSGEHWWFESLLNLDDRRVGITWSCRVGLQVVDGDQHWLEFLLLVGALANPQVNLGAGKKFKKNLRN